MFQQLLTPFNLTFRKIDSLIADDQEVNRYRKSLDDYYKKIESKIYKLGHLSENRRKLSEQQTKKLNELEIKISSSMERSAHQKEITLKKKARKAKIKPILQMSQQVESQTTQQSFKNKQSNIPQSARITSKSYKEDKIQSTLFRKKQIDDQYQNESEDFFSRIGLNLEDAQMRRNSKIIQEQQRVQEHNKNIEQHLQKNIQLNTMRETEKLNQLLQKLGQQSTKLEEFKQRIHQTQKIKQRKLKYKNNLTQKTRIQLDKNKQDRNLNWLNKTTVITRYNNRSPQSSQKNSCVLQKINEFQQQKELQAQEILEKHYQLAQRNRIKSLINEELQNTQQYFNFKVKQFL